MNYIVRVTGLGPVKALFLPHAQTENEARRHAEVSNDPRRTNLGIYRIWRVTGPAPTRPGLYLHTGIKRKAKGDVLNRFFLAKSDTDALLSVITQGWDKQNKLYRCEPL